MILMYVVKVVLMVLALLVAVPALTAGGVAVRRGGFCRGLVVLLIVGLLNLALWLGFTLLTVGGAVVVNYLTFGLLGLVVNAVAFQLAGAILPEVLYVRSFGSAFWASLVMTLCSMLIHMIH